MSVVRMNESHRTFLCTLASEQVRCDAEEKADKIAYAKAVPLVCKILEAKFPAKDMKLLAKYEVAHPDTCVKLQLTAGGVVQFEFRDEKAAPMRPDRYECRNQIYAADDAATAAVSASLTAKGALAKARAKKLEDYRALVMNTPTLEQIESVWPAAKVLRERLNRTLPVTLSADVIARIKADVSSMARAA